jgi:nucleoside-diphosphate-sugar epimerase
VKPLVGDVCDPFYVRQALDGADAVIHCAFGSRGSIEERWRTTVDGTRNVICAATEQGVRRLVHISTAEVYSPHIEGVFDEKAPRIHEDPTDREYEQQKAVAERMVVSNFEDYVVLQPGIVYGPFGKQWTVAQLERLNRGVRGLPAGNDGGWCNAIYVDDVVDAALAAVGIGPAYGSTLLLNGPEVVCWGQFFDGLRTASAALPEHNDHDRVTCDDIAVPEWESALYQRQAIADSSLARATLGWSPQFDLQVGMELTRRWAEWMHRPLTDA